MLYIYIFFFFLKFLLLNILRVGLWSSDVTGFLFELNLYTDRNKCYMYIVLSLI